MTTKTLREKLRQVRKAQTVGVQKLSAGFDLIVNANDLLEGHVSRRGRMPDVKRGQDKYTRKKP
jgi:hypothetical protein